MIVFAHHPDWRLLAAGLLAGLWLFWSYRTGISRPNRLVASGLILIRALLLATIVFCLLNPERVTSVTHRDPAQIAVLVDSSRSMGIRDMSEDRLTAGLNWVHAN